MSFPSSVYWQFRLLFCICFQSSQQSHLFGVRKCMAILVNRPQQILLLLFNVICRNWVVILNQLHSSLSHVTDNSTVAPPRLCECNKNSPCFHFHLFRAAGMNASDPGSEKCSCHCVNKRTHFFVTLADAESRLRSRFSSPTWWHRLLTNPSLSTWTRSLDWRRPIPLVTSLNYHTWQWNASIAF